MKDFYIKYCLVVFTLLLIVLGSSCRKDFEYTASEGNLRFSKDTVFLDTVFTNIGSATYTLKVYNRSNNDIEIPYVGLQNGQTSSYRLNVDGLPGKEFENIPLLAKDSLFVFIETTFDIQTIGENEFLYTDAIRFGTGNNAQEVPLVTLVKDAVFLYPQQFGDGMTETLLLGLDEDGNEIRVEGFLLEDDELDFTNEKPYVIYGYAAVPENRTVTMQAGTRVHFHESSGLLVGPNASLNVNGVLSTDLEAMENEVIFEGDRLEPEFADLAGQWGTIWLAQGSTGNTIDHLTVKNATVGILVEATESTPSPTLTIRNSQIFNSSNTNLWAISAHVRAENTVFGNSGSVSLYCNLGGTYDFKHCTIANYWGSGFRTLPSLLIDNFTETPAGEILSSHLTNTVFSNCIIDGNRSVEMLLLKNDTATFQLQFDHCSLQFDDLNGDFEDDSLYDFTDIQRYNTLFLNIDNRFEAPGENNFNLGMLSGCIDIGDPSTAALVPQDILGNDRTAIPDIGAYEFFPGN